MAVGAVVVVAVGAVVVVVVGAVVVVVVGAVGLEPTPDGLKSPLEQLSTRRAETTAGIVVPTDGLRPKRLRPKN